MILIGTRRTGAGLLMRDSVIASIITFNSDLEKLKLNIKSIMEQVIEIIIIDNNSYNIDGMEEVISEISTEKKTSLKIIRNTSNIGIASALNQAMLYASDNQYEWLLTLDQDSQCENKMIESMLTYYKTRIDKEEIIILAPTYHDINEGTILKKNRLNKSVLTAITSGSLIRVKYANSIGGFVDKLFIDHVDHEFCLRANSRGFKVAKLGDLILYHEIGNASTHKLLFITISTSNHSSKRCYYYSRNSIYLIRNYYTKYPVFILKIVLNNISRIAKILFFEEHKCEKITSMFNGYFDALKNRYGK